jgi:ubiquinone/menaquinone biosynthesis C-methylase UbiE
MSNINSKILEESNFVEECYTAQIRAFSGFEYGYIRDLIVRNGYTGVLDVGTGTGEYLKGLAALVPEVSFTAIDADATLIGVAGKKNAVPNITFCNQMFDQDFPADEYDLILARFAVEHMPDVPGFVAEAHKRLKPGGMLLITEYYIDDLHSENEVWRLFRQKEYEVYLKFGSHPRISTRLPAYMRDAGFGETDSLFRHISPSTVGREAFYNLIIAYANLYHNLEGEIFTEAIKNRIISYCGNAIGDLHAEDGLMVSYTFGRKMV